MVPTAKPTRILARTGSAGRAKVAVLISRVGQRFGRLVLLERVDRNRYIARCDCGTVKLVWMSGVRGGRVVSCGCRREEWLHVDQVTHDMSQSPLYGIWVGMKQRCSNPKNSVYRYYGGRGISVIQSWKDDFNVFMDWALENGYVSGLQIDRRDNDGNYGPDNCRFVTALVNINNRRVTRIVTAFGESKALTFWALDPRCVVCREALSGRLDAGWDPEVALTSPLVHQNYVPKRAVA
jgi:hypothetical protein